jgi:hypothetical protein
MFTDYQLRSFEHYVKTTPKSLLGVYPLTPEGAYDAIHGARGHGFGQRRGIPYRAFSRGGAFAFDAGENLDPENPNMSKSGNCLVALEKYLSQKLSTEEMQEISPMIETLCHHVKSEAMNSSEDDGETDNETMDKRRARDNPPPFANGGRPNPGGRVDPADPQMRGRAGDARPRHVTRAAADSFAAMFPNASPIKHV